MRASASSPPSLLLQLPKPGFALRTVLCQLCILLLLLMLLPIAPRKLFLRIRASRELDWVHTRSLALMFAGFNASRVGAPFKHSDSEGALPLLPGIDRKVE